MTDETKCQVCPANSMGQVWGVCVCRECLGAWVADCAMPTDAANVAAMDAAAKAFLRKRRDDLKAGAP